MTFQLYTQSYSCDAYYKVYESSASGYQQRYTFQPMSYTGLRSYDYCLKNGLSLLRIENNSGWDCSQLSILVGSNTIGTYIVTQYVQEFNFFVMGGITSSSWLYSNIPQTSTSWTTALLDWQTFSTFPEVTTITRYFRYTYTIPTGYEYHAIRVYIYTNTGFRCYLNGQVLFDWAMPSGPITASTYALNSTTTTLRSYSTLLSYFPEPINNKYYIAVEMHATSTTISGNEPFQCNLSFDREDDIILNSSGEVSSYPSTGVVDDKVVSNLFDHDLSTSWCFSLAGVTFPIWANLSFINEGHHLVNKYSVSTAQTYSLRDCTSWKLYGAMDVNNLVLLDSRTNVTWTSRGQTKTYRLSNTISYSHYIFECTELYGQSGVSFFEMADVTLMLASPSDSIDNVVEYPGFEYIIAKGSYFTLSPISSENVVYTLESGNLPQGLTLQSSTGTISGIPTQITPSQLITIIVHLQSEVYHLTLLLQVITPPSALLYPSSINTFYKNVQKSIIPTYQGDFLSFSIVSGSLPTGLSIDPSTGSIFGIPSQITTTFVTIQASNSVGSTSTVISIVIEEQPTLFSYPQSSYVLKNGDEFNTIPLLFNTTTSFTIQSGILPTGLSLNPTTGVISGTPSLSYPSSSLIITGNQNGLIVSTTIAIQVITPLSSFSYPSSSIIQVTGNYFTISPTLSGELPSFSIISGTLPVGYSLNPTSGQITGISNQEILSTVVTIQASNSVSSLTTSLTFTLVSVSNFFSYSSSPVYLSVNQNVSMAPITSYSFSIFSLYSGILPQGLSLNPTTGVISGSPTSIISTSVTIQALYNTLVVSTTVNFIVVEAPMVTYPSSQYNLTSGYFSTTPISQGSDLTYSIVSGSLPSGLSLDSYNGMITGSVYQQNLITHVVIKVQNSVGSYTCTLTFQILLPPTNFKYPSSTYSYPYQQYVSLVPSYTCTSPHFSITSGSLPSGLYLDENTGSITGEILQESGSFSIEVTISNDVGSQSFVLAINILEKPFVTYPQTTFNLAITEAFSVVPIASSKSYFSISSGVLPSGLSLDSNTGCISGTPNEVKSGILVEITVQNGIGNASVSLAFNISEWSIDLYLQLIEAIVLIILIIIVFILLIIICVKNHKIKKLQTTPTQIPLRSLQRTIPLESSSKKKQPSSRPNSDDLSNNPFMSHLQQNMNTSPLSSPMEPPPLPNSNSNSNSNPLNPFNKADNTPQSPTSVQSTGDDNNVVVSVDQNPK